MFRVSLVERSHRMLRVSGTDHQRAATLLTSVTHVWWRRATFVTATAPREGDRNSRLFFGIKVQDGPAEDTYRQATVFVVVWDNWGNL